MDPGLLLFEGKLNDETTIDSAISHLKSAIEDGLDKLSDRIVQKIKNKIRTNLIQSEVNILNKVISLAYFEMLGNIELINNEGIIYDSIDQDEMIATTKKYIDFNKANTLVYESVGNFLGNGQLKIEN